MQIIEDPAGDRRRGRIMEDALKKAEDGDEFCQDWLRKVICMLFDPEEYSGECELPVKEIISIANLVLRYCYDKVPKYEKIFSEEDIKEYLSNVLEFAHCVERVSLQNSKFDLKRVMGFISKSVGVFSDRLVFDISHIIIKTHKEQTIKREELN